MGAAVATAAAQSVQSEQPVHPGVAAGASAAGSPHPRSDWLSARMDAAWLPRANRVLPEDGTDAKGETRSARAALLGDWYPFRGLFRATAGLSFGSTRGEVAAAPGSAARWTVAVASTSASTGTGTGTGTATRTSTSTDQAGAFTTRIEVPSTMPYVGLGWGHAPARGWGLRADAGMLVGTGKVTGDLPASVRAKVALAGMYPQAELQRELQTLTDGALKISVVPVMSLGMSYRW
jgi:hypothetical protein